MVSKRLQLFGHKPVEGDFVLVNSNHDGIDKDPLEAPQNIDGKFINPLTSLIH